LASLNSIGANNSSFWTTPAQVTGLEINELLQTDSFIRAVIQQTNLEQNMGAGQAAVTTLIMNVRKDVWVTPLGDNQLQINGSYGDPMTASQFVNGVIEGYVQWKINGSQAQSEAAQGFFNDLIKNYQADLDAARQAMKTYLDAHPQSIRGDRPDVEQLEIKRLQGDIDMASARLSSALDKEENARLAQAQSESDARQTYIMIDAPQPSQKPETSLRQMAAKFGLFLAVGLILSLTAVVGGALLDHSFRFPYDVTNALNLSVLAIVPEANLKPEKKSKKSRSKKKIERLNEERVVEGIHSADTMLIPQLDKMTISKDHNQDVESAVDLSV